MFTLPSLQEIFMSLPGVLMGFTFHEFGHAWTATMFGDDTPRHQGRVTLNPLAHLDPIGTILLLIGGFGWAKPVQVNVGRLRPRVIGDIVVSLAGVAMNFLLAVVFYVLAVLVATGVLLKDANPVILETLKITARINIWLIAFNLIPLPPLDGFHVAKYLFPPSMNDLVATLYRMGPIILMVLFVTGIVSPVMEPLAKFFQDLVVAAARPFVMLFVPSL